MTSFVTRDRAGRFWGVDLASGPDRSAEVTITIERGSLKVVNVTLDDLRSTDLSPKLAEAVRLQGQRIRAAMEGDMLALIRGEPSRADMKPARARRVK